MNTCSNAIQGRNQTREGLESPGFIIWENVKLENIRLKDELNKHFRIYADSLAEKVCLQARIDTLRDVIGWEIGEEYKC